MSIGEILLRSRYQPLKRVLSYDVFNTGFNGWMTLMPNFTEYPDFDVPKTLVNKDQWPPVMLSSATFRYPGVRNRVCMRVLSAILVWDSMYRRVENVTM